MAIDTERNFGAQSEQPNVIMLKNAAEVDPDDLVAFLMGKGTIAPEHLADEPENSRGTGTDKASQKSKPTSIEKPVRHITHAEAEDITAVQRIAAEETGLPLEAITIVDFSLHDNSGATPTDLGMVQQDTLIVRESFNHGNSIMLTQITKQSENVVAFNTLATTEIHPTDTEQDTFAAD